MIAMGVAGARLVPALWLLSAVAAGPAAAVGNLVISVADYGASPSKCGPDALRQCTDAFRRALADVAAAGGGTIRVPPGTFHLGPLNLTSNLVLWLSAGTTLKADTNPKHIPLLPALPAYGPGGNMAAAKRRAQQFMRPQADLRDAIPRYQPLLHGRDLRNVTITGENGTLDGQGESWWKRWLSEPLFGRPHLVQFERSHGVVLRNVTLRNPGFWSAHFWLCEHVTVQFLTILVVPWDPPVRPTNTDGINPDSSSHVLIEDAYLQTGDDSIAIKSGWDCFGRRVGAPSRNITIRRVVVRQTRGCNAAAFTVGSEMSGGVEDVLIEDSHVIHAGVGVEVKVGTVRGGFVRGVLARNLTIQETSRGALVVMAVYPEQNPFCTDSKPPVPVVSGVAFEDVRVEGPTRGKLVQMQGTAEVRLRNLSVRGLRGEGTWLCTMIQGTSSDNVPPACPALRPEDAEPEPPNWRNDGRCGEEYPEGNGGPGRCPTVEEFEAEAGDPSRASAETWLRGSPCCSAGGWCGGAEEHCSCPSCVDYRLRQRPPARAPAPASPSIDVRDLSDESPEEAAGQPPPAAATAVGSSLVPPWPPPMPLSAAAGAGAGAGSDDGVGSNVEADGLRPQMEPPAQGLIMACVLGLCAVLCLLLSRRSAVLPKGCWCRRRSGACVALLAALGALQQLLSAVRPPSEQASAAAAAAARAAGLGARRPAHGGGSRTAASGPPAPAGGPAPVPAPLGIASGPGRPAVLPDPARLAAASSSSSSSSSAGADSGDRSSCHLAASAGPLDFGARGDGRADDTAAVRAALEYGARCGVVVVLGPKGRRFLVSPNGLRLQLRDVTVRFEGQLLGPSLRAWNPRMESWPKGSCAYGEVGCSSRGGRSPEFARSHWSLLHLQDSSNVTLLGPGGLRAPGKGFWEVRNSRPGVRGYCLLKLERSHQLRVSGLRLIDSPMYQVVVMQSRDVDLTGLRITVADNNLGDAGPHNTDGVSIIASEAVRLRDSEIESGDDNVVIKEGSRGVFAEGLRLIRGKGISIGSLGERGAQDQVVSDVLFRNVSLKQCVHGARIKTWKGGQGLVRNVSFESFRVQSVSVGILLDQTYCPPSQRPEGCADGGDAAIRIEDVHFRDFSGTYVKEDRRILCVRCSDITYDDVQLTREPSAELPQPVVLPWRQEPWRQQPLPQAWRRPRSSLASEKRRTRRGGR